MNTAPKPHKGPLPTMCIKDVMAWNPCWIEDHGRDEAREMVAGLFGKRRFVNALDILNCRKISADDRLWCVLRPDVLPEQVLHLAAVRFSGRALRRESKQGREVEERSRAALKAKTRWIQREITDQELSAALSAALSAESAALSAALSAESAARSAALNAARSAALSAARSAALNAARSAALNAALSAALSAESAAQIRILRKLLNGAQDERS